MSIDDLASIPRHASDTHSRMPSRRLIELEPGRPEDSCFHRAINIDGSRVAGYATYDLLRPKTRNLLLVKGSRASALIRRLSPADRNRLDQLETALKAQAIARPSRIDRVKAFVNQIYDSDRSGDHVGIAVHKFGPVPVALVGDPVDEHVGGGSTTFVIGIYPDDAVRKGGTARPGEMRSHTEYIRSLSVGLPRTFERYFEDVAELLYDIEHHSNVVQGLAKARDVEAVLGASIGTKLDVILKGRSIQTIDARGATEAANDIRALNPDILATATYVHAFVKWSLQRYYQGAGIKASAKATEKQLHTVYKQISQQFADDSAVDVGLVLPEILALHRGAQPVFGGASDEFERVIGYPATTPWVKRLLDFLAFAEHAQSKRIPTRRPRVFLSAHLDSPLSERFYDALYNIAHSNNDGPGLEILNVTGRDEGSRFFFLARNGISLSDSVVAVVPKLLGKSGGKSRDYRWLAREMEHGMLLKEPVLPVVERHTDSAEVLRDIARTDGLLAPRARTTGRMDRVVDLFQNQVFTNFHLESDGSIDHECRMSLARHVAHLVERRAETLLRASLDCIPEVDREIAARVHFIAKYPKTRGQIANSLTRDPRRRESAGNALKRMIRRSKQRSIQIDGSPFPLIYAASHDQYLRGAPALVAAVLPDWTEEQVLGLCDRVMRDFVDQGYVSRLAARRVRETQGPAMPQP
jgi:hypothetical protein